MYFLYTSLGPKLFCSLQTLKTRSPCGRTKMLLFLPESSRRALNDEMGPRPSKADFDVCIFPKSKFANRQNQNAKKHVKNHFGHKTTPKTPKKRFTKPKWVNKNVPDSNLRSLDHQMAKNSLNILKNPKFHLKIM